MKKFRVAIIGHTGRGNYGHDLDVVWKQFEQLEVVAVADADEAGRQAAVPRVGAQRAYADYRAMLEKERPEIVAICPRWIDQHRDMVLACAEYGCHMSMEKPFCRTLEEADEMVRACEMRHLKLAVAHISRYSPQLQIVKQLIRSGEIGDMLEIRARGKEDTRGGSEDLWVLGTHVLDLMHAIAGDVESCFATVLEKGKPITKADVRAGNEGLGPLAGDHVEAMYRFKNGVTGFFASHRGAAGNPSRFGLRVLGSKGAIDMTSGYGNPAYIIKDPSWASARAAGKWQTISSNGVDKPETIAATGYAGGNPASVRDLLEAIEKDRQPLSNMYEARAATEMILAVFESHRVGRAVSFPLENRGNALAML